MDPQKLQKLFYLGQIAIGAIFLIATWLLLRPRSPESQFRSRESDRPQGDGPRGPLPPERDLAQARLKPREAPLRLPGIRIDGPPHEVLGVARDATADQIQRAYRELMKRYHPDKVGRPGTREWSDAQKIAEALNQAKDELLKRAR